MSGRSLVDEEPSYHFGTGEKNLLEFILRGFLYLKSKKKTDVNSLRQFEYLNEDCFV